MERTAAEQVEFERLKAEYYGRKQAASSSQQKAPPRSAEKFTKVTDSQWEKLICLGLPARATLFAILLRENFRHRGKSFVLPTDKLTDHGGLDLSTQRRALRQLESCGLISVQRRAPRPPQITIL